MNLALVTINVYNKYSGDYMQEQYKDKELLIICPTDEKMKILNKLKEENSIYDIKFMTIEEFKSNYFFSYDEKAIYYLMKKYSYNIDVCKVYLNNLYPIDIAKNYKSTKLQFLKSIKQELIENNLLYFNPSFKKYLEKKTIIIKNYYKLEKYLDEILNNKIELETKYELKSIIEYKTMEEEINGVCLEIIDLIKNNIPLNKIFLTNITTDYNYSLKKIFSYYNIPINIDMNYSLYSTKIVKDYLLTNELDLTNLSKLPITKKLVNIVNSLSFLDSDDPLYKTILIDKLKNTELSSKKIKDAINIKNLYNQSFADDEYVFVLGFNQDILPKMVKDESFINDSIKDEVKLYKTDYLNTRNKAVTTKVLSNIKNLYLSYKLETPFKNFYKSSLINDLNLEITSPKEDKLTFTNKYNKIRLGEALDLYKLYNTKSDNLKTLLTHYNIPYNTYSNHFSKIDNNNYLNYLDNNLRLSYTSLNSYSECKFKYYIKYILKLDPFVDTFQSYIGQMYHKILSLYKKTNFNFLDEYNKYLEKRELSLKEKVLLIRLKKELLELIDLLNKQELITGYNDSLYEKKIDLSLSKKINVIFTGTIDKIMYYKKIEDTYFSIIDYKSGSVDTNIELMKYGLHMQLPVYLYLIHYSKVFANPIFTGIYYQNILFPYPNYEGKDISLLKQERIKLQGYSIEDPSIIERFDSTMEKSELIKSMAYTEEKGFSRYSKVINDDTLYELVKYTKNYISKETDEIIEGDFFINPKYYDGENISCKFCSFRDLCYMKERDIKYLDKVDNLDFLGGDNNA